jgi:hypothetical protein
MDNLIYAMVAMFAILVFFGVLFYNISRELDKQFVHFKLVEGKIDGLSEKIELVNSEAVKRHEIIWEKIDELRMAILEKCK